MSKCKIMGFISLDKRVRKNRKEIEILLSSNWLDGHTQLEYSQKYKSMRSDLDVTGLEKFRQMLIDDIARLRERYHA